MNYKSQKRISLIAAAAIAIVTIGLMTSTATDVVAQEQQLAAKKAAFGGDSFMAAPIVQLASTGEKVTEPTVLSEIYLKSNDKGDWLVDMTAECAVMTHIEGKGKMKDSAGAFAGADVWFELDGEKISIIDGMPTENADDATWNFCGQVFEIKTTLNELIERDAEGNPTFVCTEEEALDDSCQQAVELYLENSGSYNAKALLRDVSSGVHQLRVIAEIQSGSSSNFGEGSDDDAFVDASAVIGKRIVVAEPIHLG